MKQHTVYQELISPFFATKKNRYTTFIIILFIVLPFIYYLSHVIVDTDKNFKDYVSIAGIWFSLFGILFTLRIFLEIKTKSQHNFEEFVSVLLDMINRSRTDDKLYLILPTLFIGATGHKMFHDRFCNTIKTLARARGELNISIFEYNIDDIQNLKAKCESVFNCNEPLELEELRLAVQNELSYLKKVSPLIRFHSTWNTSFKNLDEKIMFFYNLSKFICELEEISQDQHNAFKIHKIRKNYFIDKHNIEAQGSSGLFLFANSKINIYYLGTISIKQQEDIIFQNAIIENIDLHNEFENIYCKFVTDNC